MRFLFSADVPAQLPDPHLRSELGPLLILVIYLRHSRSTRPAHIRPGIGFNVHGRGLGGDEDPRQVARGQVEEEKSRVTRHDALELREVGVWETEQHPLEALADRIVVCNEHNPSEPFWTDV